MSMPTGILMNFNTQKVFASKGHAAPIWCGPLSLSKPSCMSGAHTHTKQDGVCCRRRSQMMAESLVRHCQNPVPRMNASWECFANLDAALLLVLKLSRRCFHPALELDYRILFEHSFTCPLRAEHLN